MIVKERWFSYDEPVCNSRVNATITEVVQVDSEEYDVRKLDGSIAYEAVVRLQHDDEILNCVDEEGNVMLHELSPTTRREFLTTFEEDQ